MSKRKVAFRASNGQFVCAEGGGGRDLVANRNQQGAWEDFDIVDRGNGQIALRAINGQFVCAENDGASNLTANRSTAAEWETFTLEHLADGKVALKACNNKYVRAVNGGGGTLIADRTTIGDHEKFSFVETLPNRRVRLKASNGKYLCANNGGGGELFADKENALEWETFTLVRLGNGKVALQTWTGQFMQAVNGGGGLIGAAPNAVGAYETFDLIDRGNGKIALRACNGKYVSSEDGKKAVTANRTAIAEWEEFSVEEGSLSWGSLGKTALGTPSIISSGPGRLDVFIRGTDNALWRRRRTNGVWGEWIKVGHELTSEPSAVSWATDHIDVFYRGPDGTNLHVWTLDGANFSTPAANGGNLGGRTNAAPGATSRAQGQISHFHRGLDQAYYLKTYSNNVWQENWHRLDGIFASGPAVASRGGSCLDVLGRGMDDGLYHWSYNDADLWQLGRVPRGTIASAPTVVSPGSNRLTVFARHSDGALYSLDFNGNHGPGWQSWVALSDGATSPASAAMLDGKTCLVARSIDGTVIFAELDAYRWPVPSNVVSLANQQAVSAALQLPASLPSPEAPFATFSTVPAALNPIPVSASNWMASIPGINTKTLRDICLPRTHDSATASLTNTLSPDVKPPFLAKLYPSLDTEWVSEQMTDGVPSELKGFVQGFLIGIMIPIQPYLNSKLHQVLDGWGRAQGNTILQQLQNGIRWFDLRICKVNGELRSHHGLAGQLISGVLDDVLTFVSSNHGEVVIVDVGQMDSLTAQDHSNLITMIVNKLKGSAEYLFPYVPGTKLGTVPIGTMTNQGARSRVVVVYSSGYEGHREAHPDGNQIWQGAAVAVDRDGNKDNDLPNKIMSRQANFLATHSLVHPNFVDMDYAYAPTLYDVLASVGMLILDALEVEEFEGLPMYKLEHMALAINFTLVEFVKSIPRSSLEKINSINIDFADRSPVTNIAIALSNRDYDAINTMDWSDTVALLWLTVRDEVWGRLKRLFELLGLLKLVEAAVEIVIGFCKAVPGLVNDAAGAATMALSWGIDKATAAFGLAAQYCLNPVAATRLVANTAEEAAEILKNTFQRPAQEVYHTLTVVYGASEDAAKEVLGGVGYAADEIEDIANKVGEWLSDLF